MRTEEEWDERYASHGEAMWSGRANGVLKVELTGHPPGSALDVGCGEGGDAIWLARAGWQVTGLDVSQVALDRAAAAAREAGVTVEWIRADITDAPTATYDLVSVHYPALEHAATLALVGAVAPGGTLLVVGHWPLDHEHARARGFEIEDYIQPPDVRDRLGDEWEIEVDETRPRVDPPHKGSPHTHDAILRAQRR